MHLSYELKPNINTSNTDANPNASLIFVKAKTIIPNTAAIASIGNNIGAIAATIGAIAVIIPVNIAPNVGSIVPIIKILNPLATFNAVPKNLISFPLNSNTILPIIEPNNPIFS